MSTQRHLCEDSGHNWYCWQARPESEREVSPFWYVRECQQLGCDARQYAERLEPAGRVTIVRQGECNEHLAEWREPPPARSP